MHTRPLVIGAVLGLLACSDAAAPRIPGGSFTFTVPIGAPPAPVATGDSTYWELFPATLGGPLFSAFLTSPDSLGTSPAPTNFYLTQRSPVFQNGSLAAGAYDLTPIDSTVMSFGLSYPDFVNGAHSAVSDSGLLTITSPTGDSVVRGSVSAWMHEYQPTVGPPFHVTGHFTIVPRH